MKKWLALAVVVLCLGFVNPSWSFDGGKLSNAMNIAAATSEWLNIVMHPGMPKPWTNPLYPQKIKELGEAQKTMSLEIGSIETPEELKAAKAIAESFKASYGCYRDVGYQAEILITEREKFLQLHGN